MNIKNKSLFFLIVILSVLIISGCQSESQSSAPDAAGDIEEMTIQLAGITAPDHPLTLGGEKFKELVEEKSEGKIKVEFFPSNQLGSIREQTEQVQLGTIQMTQTLLSTVTSFNETLQVFEYPFLWPSNEEMIWNVLEGEAGESALESLESSRFKGLGFWAGGFKAITSNKPILSPSDMRGTKMRVIPSEILQKTYETYGANPVPIDFTETYNALQQGVVDAQENPIETIFTEKYHEVQDHLTVANHGYQFYMFIANLDWFNSLSPETQDLLIEAEEEARIYARDLTRESEKEKLSEFPSLGMEVHELPEDVRKEFEELSLPLHKEFSDTPEKQELLEKIYEELGM